MKEIEGYEFSYKIFIILFKTPVQETFCCNAMIHKKMLKKLLDTNFITNHSFKVIIFNLILNKQCNRRSCLLSLQNIRTVYFFFDDTHRSIRNSISPIFYSPHDKREKKGNTLPVKIAEVYT